MRILLAVVFLALLGWLAFNWLGDSGQRVGQATDTRGPESVQRTGAQSSQSELRDAAVATLLAAESESKVADERAALAPQAAAAVGDGIERSATLIVHVTPRHLDVQVVVAVRGTGQPQIGSALANGQTQNWLWQARRGPDGTVRFENLPCGFELLEHAYLSDKHVHAHSGSTSLFFKKGEVREIFVELKEPVTLTGVVRWDDGTPAVDEDVWVLLGGKGAGSPLRTHNGPPFRSAVTNTNGEYRIEHLAEGLWWVGVPRKKDSPDRLMPLVQPRHPARTFRLDIAPFQRLAQHDLTLHTGTYITGRIEGVDGSPRRGSVTLGSARVAADLREGHYSLHTRSDEEGNFSLGPLSPGSYALTASGNEGGVAAADVDVDAPARDVVLQLVDGFTVIGRAIDPESGQPRQANFQLFTGEPAEGRMNFGQTDPEEGEKFGGIRPGPCTVSAISRDGHFGSMIMTLTAADPSTWRADVPMRPGGKLQITYQGLNPRAQVEFIRDGTKVWADTVNNTQHALLTAPAGPLTVHVFSFRAGVRTFDREEFVVIHAGETTSLTVRNEN